MPLSRPRTILLHWLEAARRRLLPGEMVCGVRIEYSCDRATEEALSKQVQLAFLLLESRAPMWLRRVRQEIAYVSFIELGPDCGLARFKAPTRECEFNASLVLQNPGWGVVEIGFGLVHEAMHGWLIRHGVLESTPEQTLRIEGLCNRAEGSLAARVPEVPYLAELIERRRARLSDTYSARTRANRQQAYYRALLRGMIGG